MEELMELASAGVVSPEVEVLEFEELDMIIQGISKNAFGGRVVVKLPI
jgi:D-arabinose 1-dehydrogenase-like Zn-dependent alcohol dehydrogenase